jgi:ABC-2 type transport system permease protein
VNATIVRLSARAVLGRRRGVLLVILPLVLIALAVVVRLLAGEGPDSAKIVVGGLGLGVVLPLVALIATSSVLSPEMDDGSIVYLLAKPISRHTVVISKSVVAFGCAVGFAVVPILIAGLLLTSARPQLAFAYALGALAAGAAYTALFAWLSTLSRHAVVLGLVYVLLWEGLVGDLVAGVRWVSVTRWALAIVEATSGGDHAASPSLGVVYAVAATLVLVVGLTYLAGRRLQSFNLTGDE